MAKFYYKARNKNNEIIEDTIFARNINSAARILELDGFTILELNIIEDLDNFSKMKNITYITPEKVLSLQEKKSFISSLHSLYKSGTPILESFKSMLTSSSNPNIRGVCYLIIKKIEKGHSLKESMKSVSTTLGYAYTMLIAAGEKSGNLTEVLQDILSGIKREEEVKNKIIASLIYPGLLMALVVWLWIFKDFGLKQALNNIQDLDMSQRGMTLLTAAIIATIVIIAIAVSGFLLVKNRVFLAKITNSPIIYHLFKNSYMANFFNILSLAYASGVPAAECIEIATSVFNNEEARVKLKKVEKMVQNGCEIATALNISGLFSDFAISQITTGEKSGEFAPKAQAVSDHYLKNMNMATSFFASSIGLISLIIVLLIGGCLAIDLVSTIYDSYFNMF